MLEYNLKQQIGDLTRHREAAKWELEKLQTEYDNVRTQLADVRQQAVKELDAMRS